MGSSEPDRNVEITHPNRDKAASKATRATVILLLLASAALTLVITIGGWETLEGAKPVQIFYMVLYLIMAYYVARWNRGVLPVAAALAIILGIFAAVSGPEWFDRDKDGFDDPLMPSSMLGMLTLLVVPVQILLIAFSMRGFQQEWNVEVEVSPDGSRREPDERDPSGAQPATA